MIEKRAHDRMVKMNEKLPIAEIPIGFFEYTTTFKEPIFAAWYDSSHTVIIELYKVLQQWGVGLEKVSGNLTPQNMKEAQITFAVPNPSVLIHLGIGELKMVANNVDWSQAPVLVTLFQAVLNKVTTAAKANLQSHQTVLAFHVKAGPTPFRDIMNQFVNAKALGKEDPSMIGVGLYSPEYSIVIDNSLAVPNGIFVRITRVFSPERSFEDMATMLWKDEEGLLQRLGFRAQ